MVNEIVYDSEENWSLEYDSKTRSSMIESLNQILDKISVRDFIREQELSINEQVSLLIKTADDECNQAHLYHGWKPLW